ncbi:PolA DNA polymerase I - 3'-5' exonuclease and polymerase domains [uncultured Caudovirales phage]|uniref:PolA DNA polymerase I - 3'-5' exonuclease and polymerase domains n=1 Tax=uncultured Caudovirales phage TaxID=2100421 RepID=A0A6J5N1X4_9CAUD|nr:PolA DNA polymerase I - 3'-5' exonuclease and polymerase domains [uncultured Caudovirales phage]
MNIVMNVDQLKEVVDAYSQVDEFVFDVETSGPHRGDPRQNAVVWIALATEGRVDVIPMGHPNGDYIRTEYPLLPSAVLRESKGLQLRPQDYSKDERKATKLFTEAPEQLTPGEVFKALKPLFFSDQIKVGHNVKFDLQSIAKYIGGLPNRPYACTLNASFVLDNQSRNGLGLDDCLKREFDYDMVKGVGKEIEAHSFDEVATYAGLDAEWTWKLWKRYSKRLSEDKLTKLFTLEMDVLEVICSMELRGADIDVSSLEDLKVSLEEQLEECKAEIYKAAGKSFNLNSVQEKQKLLYSPKKSGGRGLKPKIPTTNGKKKLESGEETFVTDFSVSEQALNALAGKDPLVDGLIKYSDLNKLLTTYVIPYLGGDITRTTGGKSKIVAKKALLLDGRVHTDFVQYGAETGRFSSRNPNLQNVPAPHTSNGKAIRNLFIAPEDHSLVVADYSQIEPRVIASFSKDRIMTSSYLEGGDIYTTVGNTMGVDRKAGKVLVLAMAYGVGPDKIADQIGCTVTEAKDLLAGFSAKFPSIDRYKRSVISESRSKAPVPYATTLLKRRRYLPDLRSREVWKRSRAERQAFNTVIQGSAADIIKVAMVRAYSMIPEEANLILTVHDELVTVTPNHLIEETAEAIRSAMEGIQVLSIPLLADVKTVTRWGEAK